MAGLDEPLDQPGDIAVRHHHALGDIRQRHAVGRLVELRHQIEARQRDVEPLPQPAPHLTFDQVRAGQQAQPEPKLVGMIIRKFDGLGLGIKNHDAFTAVWTHPAAPRAGFSADCFDLQIIRSLLQVKMTLAWRRQALARFL